MTIPPLSHLDGDGRPRMVDVSGKPVTWRSAMAAGCLQLGEGPAQALEAACQGAGKKGDPWTLARIGAIQGAKRAADLIPLAHPMPLAAIEVEHQWDAARRHAWIRVVVRAEGRTGVEMEAMAAVTAGLLVLYDMLKAAGQDMTLGPIRLLEKNGGKHGRLEQNLQGCPW